MSEFATKKLSLFPRKLEQLTALRDEQTNGMDTTYPISVELSLTDACTFKCGWCSDSDLRNRLRGFMKQITLDPLLEDLAGGGVRGIVFEGGGEPTLHPLLGYAMGETHKLGMGVGLITNGVRFNYKDEFDGVEWVRVSLDVSNDTQMDTLKKQGAFPIVMDNIAEMVRLRGPETTVGISYIVTEQSAEGLEDMVRRLKDIGVDYVQIKPVVDHPELAFSGGERLKELAKYSTENFSVYTQALSDNVITGNGGVPCVANSMTTVISANGNVYFCGRLNTDPDWPALGNVNHASFNDIWHGEERLRQSRIMRQVDECQARCPECRITKFNQALAQGLSASDRPVGRVRTPNFI